MFLCSGFSNTNSVTLDALLQHCPRSRILDPSASWKLPATCKPHLIASTLLLTPNQQLPICILLCIFRQFRKQIFSHESKFCFQREQRTRHQHLGLKNQRRPSKHKNHVVHQLLYKKSVLLLPAKYLLRLK